MMRKMLDGKVPLIGFTGAPVSEEFVPIHGELAVSHSASHFLQWTLMGYMIEGGGSKTMEKSKNWLTAHPESSKKLLDLLTDVIVEYLEMQINAGAQLLQVFESSAEHLSKEQFLEIAMPQLKAIRVKLLARLAEKNVPAVPMVSNVLISSTMIGNNKYLPLDAVRQGRWSFAG